MKRTERNKKGIMSSALAALEAAEAALDIAGAASKTASNAPIGTDNEAVEQAAQVESIAGQARHARNDSALPPQLGFAERGSELLAKMEAAMLAEVRTNPTSSGKALDKATAIVEDTSAAAAAQNKSKRPPRPAVEEHTGIFVEDALAKSLAKMEHSILLHVRSEAATHRGMHGGPITRADQTIRAVQQRDALIGRSSAFFKTGKRGAPPKRPASAPLVHLPTKSGEEALRIRQRAYDDARSGRAKHHEAPAFARYQLILTTAGV